MQLDLWRHAPVGDATTGDLNVDGQFQCYTLEDLPHPTKISGQTRIPAGTYDIIISWSPRFQRRLPLLLNVPGFDGIRIHPGNTAADTEGCILVGTQMANAMVLNSRVAFEALFGKLSGAFQMGDTIQITVHDSQMA